MRQITELAKAGHYAEAVPAARQIVKQAEATAGKNHPITALAIATLASVQVTQGELDEAETLLKRVLTLRQKTLSPNHADIAVTLLALGQIALAQARYGDAETLVTRAKAH